MSSSPTSQNNERARRADVSSVQQRFWFLDQLKLYASSNHALRLSGPIDLERFAASIRAVFERHDVLRSSFPIVDGRPVQEIHDDFEWPMSWGDLVDLEPSCLETETRRLLETEIARPFDLERGPLIRGTLIRTAAHEHIWLLSVHRLVADLFSINLLLFEIAEFYETKQTGAQGIAAATPIQYLDFARQLELDEENLERLLRFWKEQITGLTNPLHLPYERSQATLSWTAARLSRHLPYDLVRRFESLCERLGSPVKTAILALYAMVLHRLTGRERILVGLPITNRDLPGALSVVGPLANILVVSVDFSKDRSISDVIRTLAVTMNKATEHQQLPFEVLVRELKPDVVPGHPPFTNVAFDAKGDDFAVGLKLHGLEIGAVDLGDEKTPFSLKLVPRTTAGSITLELVFQIARFDKDWVEVFLSQLVEVVDAAVADPEIEVSALSLVTPSCRLLIPDPRLELVREDFELVGQRILRLAGDVPEAPAVQRGTTVWSYGELASSSLVLARRLVAAGVSPGDSVAIIGAMSYGAIVSMNAVLLSGGVLVTLDPHHPVIRRQTMLELADARWMVCVDEALPEDARTFRGQVFQVKPDSGVLDGDTSRRDGSEIDSKNTVLPDVTPDDPAYLAFTSGTTGRPKGILGLHRGLSHAVYWQGSTFGISRGDRCAQLATMSFDTLFRETYLALTSGACLVLRDDDQVYAADEVLSWLEKERITLLNTVPAMLQMWSKSITNGVELAELRLLFLVGEALSDTVIEAWRKNVPRAGRIINLYGTTETNLLKLFYEVPVPALPGFQPVGFPLPGAQALVLASNALMCGRGETGEVFVRTPYLSRGYIKNPGMNAEKFIQNPFRDDATDLMYRTGDRGRYRLDGSLEVAARFDRQVKIRGVRIEPDEISAHLARQPGVKSCAVGVRTVGRNQLALYGYVVLDPGKRATESELIDALSLTLPQAMLPRRIVFLSELPLSTAGRIDHHALEAMEIAAPAESGFTIRSKPVAIGSRREVEEVLRGLWAELTESHEIGLDQSFLESGGDSLLATQFISRIGRVLHAEVPLRAFFESPTISQLADVVLRRLLERDSRNGHPIKALRRGGDFPLSYAQQRLWFVHNLLPESTANNLPTAFRLNGEVVINNLERALSVLVNRHESLRTSFPTVDGTAQQRIAAFQGFRFPIVDLTMLPSQEREAELRRLIEHEAARVFDIEKGPLLHVVLFRLSAEQSVILINLHHIVSDGWSQGIFFHELSQLYDAFSAHEKSPLVELQVQYADFAVWQREWLEGENLERQLDFWTKELADLVPLDLPTDHYRPANPTFEGAAYEIVLPEDLSTALEGLSLKAHTSLFMTLMAGFMVVLHRWTGQTEIVVGAPIASRNREEIEGLIGFFVNNLVLRGDLSGDPIFFELLERIREKALSAYAHQDLPFDRLVEKLVNHREFGRHPLFQVLFALHNVPQFNLKLSGVDVQSFDLEFEPVGLDLEFHFWKAEKGLRLRIGYQKDLFERNTIARLAQLLVGVLVEVAKNPRARLSTLGLVDDSLLDSTWTQTEFPDSITIHALFEEQVARTPDGIAIEFANDSLSYRELDRRASCMAQYLRSIGVVSEDLVVLCVERSIGMIVAVLAVLKAGGAYVPLDPSFPPHRLDRMVADCGARIVITEETVRQSFATDGLRVLNLDDINLDDINFDDRRLSGESTEHQPAGSPHGLAYVIYTSGSTGEPKGVLLEHRGLCNMVMAQIEFFELGPADRIVQFASPGFDGSVWEIFCGLASGATLVLGTRVDLLPGAPLLSFLKEKKITRAVLPPSVLATLEYDPLPALKSLVVAGDICTRDLIETWGQGGRLVNGYGPTEGTVCTTLARISTAHSYSGIGKPIANVETYVLDADLNRVPEGAVGELVIGGAGIARGYLNRPELTQQRFIKNPFSDRPGATLFRSGDQVRQLPDGSLDFVGRIDRLVKLRGFRVELEEIAVVFREHETVGEVAVDLRLDEKGGERLVAYIVRACADDSGDFAHPDVDELDSTLRGYLKSRLPAFMIPSNLVFVDELPMNSAGKIDWKLLPAPPLRRAAHEFEAPRTKTERRLAAIWQEMLKIERVGICDNFFDLGGESILSVQVVARAQACGLRLTARQIFESPTIAELAKVISGEENEADAYPNSETDDVSTERSRSNPLENPEDAERHLVQLQSGTRRPPVVLVHPIGGFVLCYSRLAERLGEQDRLVYGLQAAESEDGENEAATIPAMAGHYLRALRQTEPQGPYHFMGWSMGGLIAYEMACLAAQEGDEVASLTLIDAAVPSGVISDEDMQRMKDLSEAVDASEQLHGHWAALGLEREIATLNGRTGGERGASRLVLNRLRSHVRAISAYQPGAWPGAITLVRAQQRPADEHRDCTLGWSDVVSGSIEVVIVPGDHMSIMRDESIGYFAQIISEKDT